MVENQLTDKTRTNKGEENGQLLRYESDSARVSAQTPNHRNDCGCRLQVSLKCVLHALQRAEAWALFQLRV